MHFNPLFSYRLVLTRLYSYSQKRYRHKDKWANKSLKKSSCDLALDHFDAYYKPVYGDRWPSVRIALLSQSKYCALINNFASDRSRAVLDLAELGAQDVIRKARETVLPGDVSSGSVDPCGDIVGEKPNEVNLDSEPRTRRCSTDDDKTMGGSGAQDDDPSDINRFTPVKKIFSEKEKLRERALLQGIYREPESTPAKVVDAGNLVIPFDLMAFAQDVGDISSFPPAKRDDTNKLGYYLLDAASLLPVIALGLEPDCQVLDLCAAPGGKSLAILQTLLPGELTCVDRSNSRLKRLRAVMKWYAPQSYLDSGKVKIINLDGIEFCNKMLASGVLFDRVLVDVPCFADRHVLQEEDNNIFRPSRLAERLDMPLLQQQLLLSGIKLCRPGGVVVYSTCTLSPVQNDGVIAQALERIWQDTDIDVVVENLQRTTDRFASTFTFRSGSVGNRFGSLVLPKLTANFGPMYFCRLRRTR